tara:strand:+ start:9525 stop:9743 length:219 start_codon:yes stop_codon:yes gene_type:complete
MNKKTLPEPTGQAARYEQAFNYVVNKLAPWKREIITGYLDDHAAWERVSNEVTKEIIELGQCEGWTPPRDDA